jgi:DNA-binding SARP family transcriptional activator
MESLRASVHVVARQTPGLLVSAGPVLSLAGTVSVDLHQLLEQVENCEHSSSDQTHDVCLARLQRAELLPGWYEDWVVLEQERLRSLRLRAFLAHARRWLDKGEPDRAAEAAENALALEPLHETCVGLLMRAQLDVGNRSGALHTFEKFRTRLSRELGVDPSDDLLRLAADLRL